MSDSVGRSDAAREFYRVCRAHLMSIGIFSALLNILFLAPMLYMMQVYDRVLPGGHVGTLLSLTMFLLVSLAVLALLSNVRDQILLRLSVKLDRDLSRSILFATLGGKRESLAASRQVLREFDRLRAAMSGSAMAAVFDLPWTIIFIIVAGLLHPTLGLFALAASVILIALAWGNETRTRRDFQTAQARATKAYSSYEVSVSASEAVTALGMRRTLTEHHLAERELVTAAASQGAWKLSFWASASKFARLGLQSTALGYAAWLAIGNEVSAGAVFAASFLVGRAMTPIDQLTGSWRTIVQARVSYGIVIGALARQASGPAPMQLPRPTGYLSVQALCASRPGRSDPVLSDVSFEVAPGEVVAILGPSGAGKSTLLKAMVGAISSDSGEVRYDGAELGDWDPEALAGHVGFSPQEITLFMGSVRQNISRFEQPWSEEAQAAIDKSILEAASHAGANELILQLPHGYDYRLELGGRGLSVGQAQRISLARALYGEPRYLFLDEPNANLDADGDRLLNQTLAQLKSEGTTIVLSAHRLTMMPIVDKIMVLRAGRVEAFGPRDTIVSRIRPPDNRKSLASAG